MVGAKEAAGFECALPSSCPNPDEMEWNEMGWDGMGWDRQLAHLPQAARATAVHLEFERILAS